MKKQLLMGVLFSVLGCGAVYSQDIIVTKDAKKIEAKITEVSKSEIRYKEFDNLDGPIFVLSTDEINTIIYSNGKVTLFETNTHKDESREIKSDVEPASPVIGKELDEDDASILLMDGKIVIGKIVSVNNDGITCDVEGKRKVFFAEQINKIILPDGSIKTYPHSTYNKETEVENPQKNTTIQSNKKNLHSLYIELSGFFESLKNTSGLKTDNNIAGGFGIDAVNGCRFNEYAFLGFGVGLYTEFYSTKVDVPVDATSTVKCDFSATTLQSPIFADVRLFLPTNEVGFYPYLETSVGPLFLYYNKNSWTYNGKNIESNTSMDTHVYAFFRIGLGMEIKRFTIGAGYELGGDKDAQSHLGFLKLGIRLGKNIY